MPDSDDADKRGTVVAFPFSRLRPKGPPGPARDLGLGKLAQALGASREQMSGHWCSRCKGIWFGYLLEVECPVCSNRNG